MQIGSVLKERFELTELLSEGPVGDVYVAVDKRQEESDVENPKVALKLLAKTISDNESLAGNLCRVSVRQRRLHHPNILSFFYTNDKVAKLFDFSVAEVFRDYTGPSQSAFASAHVKNGGSPRPEDDLMALAKVASRLLEQTV